MEADFKALLKAKKLKFTQGRFSIYKALKNSHIPLCYEQIKESLSMDKATFYRNMAKFEAHSIVSKFESKDRKWYYELGDGNHAHFVCETCDTIACVELEVPNTLREYEVSSMVVKGKCKECN